MPNPAGSVTSQMGQTGETPEARRTLNCQGCHGPGKTLPYLGGSLFHTDERRAYDSGFHAKAHQNGGGVGKRAATCLDCHTKDGRGDMTTMLPKSDPASPVNRANLADTCGRCHGDANVMQGSGITTRPFLSFRESVHAQAASRGNLGAAVCSDCHRAHDVLPASDSRSPIFKFNVPQTCGQCHPGITSEFSASVHGQAAARGVSQTPVCTDCHGIHEIGRPDALGSTLRTNTCAKCHEGVRLSQEFGVAGARVQSYENSYHGLARKLGSSVAADCASCHGVHNILPSSDPKSMIAQANLTQTCGQCHPGAGENFAKGKVHLNVPVSQDAGSRGVRWVRLIYLPLIFLTIGGMAVHNVLVWRKKAAHKLRQEPRTVTRLTKNQRVQHWLLLTSFIVLVVTGFALVYPGAWDYYLGLEAEGTRRWVHRVAALLMMVVGFYHLAYVAFAREGRSWLKDMLPEWKDVTDLWQNLLYYAGLRRTRPLVARFGYGEKAEYWAVVWGTFVMGLTGLMIWFKLGAFGFLPRWWVDIATAVHFYEAVLATLAIVVWHFYHVIFDPEVYPLNFAFYDGKVSEDFYREEHGLDFERMQEAGGEGERDAARPSESIYNHTTPTDGVAYE
ncbi:MAG TPA: cytochrome b/b6 domain-containing protein [Pyrinomonadaceae bacterium]|nr:cytochrome b/b6 domain-containing protein [Pyrinomonadaceae bacterium]